MGSSSAPTCNLPIPIPAAPADVLRHAADLLSRSIDLCVATVIAREGSAPATPGQKLLIAANGFAAGTVGGGGLERGVVERMLALLETGSGTAEVLSFNLGRDFGMSCGGAVQLVIEPMWAAPAILVIGAGHVGFAIAQVLPRLGFATTVIDSRESAVSPERVAALPGVRLRCGTPAEAAADFPRRGAVIVVTHDHDLDREYVLWAVEQGFGFVGGIGSRAKAVRIKDALKAKGTPEEVIARVRMPLGLEIGARTPEEIAISVAAEMVAWRASNAAAKAQAAEGAAATTL